MIVFLTLCYVAVLAVLVKIKILQDTVVCDKDGPKTGCRAAENVGVERVTDHRDATARDIRIESCNRFLKGDVHHSVGRRDGEAFWQFILWFGHAVFLS